MHFEAIQQNVRRRPFEPFDIMVSSGDRYRVNHPDGIMLTKRSVVIALPTKGRRRPLPEGYTDVSYLHIAALEPVSRMKSSRQIPRHN